jgi:predicted DNA binding CopG/RHH family protein
MGKNAHIHIRVSSEFLKKIREEAAKKMISIAEACRIRLETNDQLDRIENKINELWKKK